MKITIEYESSWRNSFLDGSNDEALPKKGRNFIASTKSLKNANNFIKRKVTKNTVMGILNRLIGDQRKLYQSRQDSNYFFKDIESQVSWVDNIKSESSEVIRLRNMKGTDPNSFTGAILSDHSAFNSDYSNDFWGILFLSFEDVCRFILHNDVVFKKIEVDPVLIASQATVLDKIKPVENINTVAKIVKFLSQHFPGIAYIEKTGKVKPARIYAAALYLQLDRLRSKYNMDSVLTKRKTLPGFSKRGYNGKRDFMVNFTTTKKAKKVWGNPYIHEEFVAGEGKIKHLLTKANGSLEINLDVEKEKAEELKTMIENAGVSSFYLGKKGLAHVVKIR